MTAGRVTLAILAAVILAAVGIHYAVRPPAPRLLKWTMVVEEPNGVTTRRELQVSTREEIVAEFEQTIRARWKTGDPTSRIVFEQVVPMEIPEAMKKIPVKEGVTMTATCTRRTPALWLQSDGKGKLTLMTGSNEKDGAELVLSVERERGLEFAVEYFRLFWKQGEEQDRAWSEVLASRGSAGGGLPR